MACPVAGGPANSLCATGGAVGSAWGCSSLRDGAERLRGSASNGSPLESLSAEEDRGELGRRENLGLRPRARGVPAAWAGSVVLSSPELLSPAARTGVLEAVDAFFGD